VDRLRVRARPALPVLAVLPVLALAVSLAAGPARADARTDLEKAYSAYVGHKYDEAEARLRALLDATSADLKDPDTIADARMYLGAVLVAEGKKDDAGPFFEALLLDRPDYEPDPLRVSTAAIDAFLDVRARMRARLASIKAERARLAQDQRAKAEADRQKEAARVAMLEKLAGEEVVTKKNSRLVALVPFGVGQFQNGQDVLGGVFLATEAALVLGSAIAAGVAYYDAVKANDVNKQFDATASQYNSYAQQAANVGNLLTLGLVFVAAVGIAHAELDFVPERVEVKRRPLPPLSLAPILMPTGVGFRF
jgi:hypothetical protein